MAVLQRKPKNQSPKIESAAAGMAGKQGLLQFKDMREDAIKASSLHETIQQKGFVQANSTVQLQKRIMGSDVLQRNANKSGLPSNLKSGIESLSGMSMDHVKVHYNSSKPAALQAHAYAETSQIDLGRGQEKHLPHEAWHVVQQAQGRVKPTMQLRNKVNINDDQGLEREADVMGAKALNTSVSINKSVGQRVSKHARHAAIALQRMPKKEKEDSDDEYVDPSSKKQKRYAFSKVAVNNTIRKTAHKRKHVNKRKFKDVYTCPGCRRPLASVNKKGSMNLTRFAFTSKGGNYHERRAIAMDHYPPWAGRLRKLESRKASESEIRKDHDDPNRVRALCSVCNGSHAFESSKNIDYESETDEEGYITDTGEPENKGFYKDFRYDPDDPGTGGAGGVTA